jgi:hypothetical protein
MIDHYHMNQEMNERQVNKRGDEAMRVETEAFTLRPWEDGDAQELAEIANNKKIYDNLGMPFLIPIALKMQKATLLL